MTVKIVGAAMILAACGWVGFAMAAAYRREERSLQQLIQALEHMKSELSYTMPPLPELCKSAAAGCSGLIASVLQALATELDMQLAPQAEACMQNALEKASNVPDSVREKLLQIGKSLGRFDLRGQLSGLEAAQELCRRDLEGLHSHREERIRSYQTLGLCAGAALVILFI